MIKKILIGLGVITLLLIAGFIGLTELFFITPH